MKFLLFVLLFVSVVCYAESDSVQAQKGTQLISFSSFKTDTGKELRVVEFNKPSIHHFFTYSNSQIFMNSVLDKQKNLREVRFTHNQFELNPYTATKDTPLAWTMTMIKAVQSKSQTALNNTALESRKSRLLIESLTRSCGNIQVFGELSDDKTAIDRYVVHVEGVGEMHTNAPVEGVSCDDRSLVVGTVKCETDKGPCFQKIVAVQHQKDDIVPSDDVLLSMVNGKVDSSGKILNLPAGSAPIYSSVLLSRYAELNHKALLYVLTRESDSMEKDSYCSSCPVTLKMSFFEFSDSRWQEIGSRIEQEIYGWPEAEYYLEAIGNNTIGFVSSNQNSQGGEGFF